jgi:hypothetical protein
MGLGRNFVLGVAVLVVVGGVGCKKRRPSLPAQTAPPTINQPTVAPVASQPLPTPPTVTTEPPQPSSTTPATTTARKTHVRRKKPPTPPVNTATSSEANAPKPGAHKPETPGDSNVQISAEVAQPAANLRRQQTEGLLQSAEWNMKKVNRTLTDGEESMQRQVRNFITQSRLALQDGDFERAYNLATKANLLSQELIK